MGPATLSGVNDVTSSEISSYSLDGVAGLVARLAHSGLPAEEFYRRFLDTLPTPVGTLGTVAWACGDDSFSKIAAGTRSNNDSVQLPVSAAEHAAQLHQVRLARVPQLFEPPPQSGYHVFVENALPNIMIFPILLGETVPVLVEAYLPPDVSATDTQRFLQRTRLLCELAANFHAATPANAVAESPTAALAAVHDSLRVQDTCFAIANEGRRAIGADRVSVLIGQGRKFRVKAVSGQDTVNSRANVIQYLERLVNRVMRTGEEFWYPEDAQQLPPEIEHELESYLEVSLARRLGILPLCVAVAEKEQEEDAYAHRRREDAVGSLVVEQFTDSIDNAGQIRARTERVSREAAIALRNATDHESIFLLPLWRWIGSLNRYFRGSLLPKTLAVLSAVLLGLAALIFVPAELKVACDGRLMPVVRRSLYAQFDGTVDELFVDHAEDVTEGQILATLRNHGLDLEMEKNRGEFRTAEAQLDAIQTERLAAGASRQDEAERLAAAAKEEEIKVRIASLEELRQILEQRRAQLSVVSPVNGKVITWDLRERLRDRPVRLGQRLMQIADLDGPWQLELSLPDRRIAEVLAAQSARQTPLPVTYVVASDNSHQYKGRVIEVERSTRVDTEKGQTVMVRVEVDKDARLLQPGTQIQAKIHCGQHRLGYVWLRDVWHFIQSRVLFPLT